MSGLYSKINEAHIYALKKLYLPIYTYFYIIFFIICFFSSSKNIAQFILIYVIAPLYLMPMVFKILTLNAREGYAEFNSVKNLVANLIEGFRPIPFCLILVYMVSVSFCTWIVPSPTYSWLFISLYFCFLTTTFYLSSARLIYLLGEAADKLYIIFSIICSINALTNCFQYLNNLDGLQGIVHNRFSANWGLALFPNPNPTALTYALYFTLIFSINSNKLCSITIRIITICKIILALAIVLTQSRGVIIAILCIYIFYLNRHEAINFSDLTDAAKKYIRFGFPIFITFLIIYYSRNSSVLNLRDEVWIKFSGLIFDRPIFGYGERLFIHIILSNGGVMSTPHNIFLAAFVYGGVIGGFSLLLFFVLSIYINFYQKMGSILQKNANILLLVSGLFDFEIAVLGISWQWLTIWLVLAILSVKTKLP